LIFTKDRPAQLDLLLRSIWQHAPLYRNVTVLAAYTDTPYLRGYETCSDEHGGQVEWWLEERSPGGFLRDVWQWLRRAASPVSFLCDDDVFYRDAVLEEIVAPWSLRAADFDYPFSLDGNIYRKDDLVGLLDGLTFRNPTQLEAQGHVERARLPFATVGHGSPCLAGVPLNRVSEDSLMPYLAYHQYHLNEQYLLGKRLDLELPAAIVSAHVDPVCVVLA
jgi:hypothetical protein